MERLYIAVRDILLHKWLHQALHRQRGAADLHVPFGSFCNATGLLSCYTTCCRLYENADRVFVVNYTIRFIPADI